LDIQEHLLDLALVGPDGPEARADGALEDDAPAAGALAHEHQGVLDGARQIEVRQLELHAAGLGLRQVQDVVDERQEVTPESRMSCRYSHLLGEHLPRTRGSR
jgi:hypothetical protein